MLDRIRRRHKGDVVAIVASGPSAALYDGGGDVSIGVNGASFLGFKFDYFLCGDKNAYTKEWFSVDCSYVRVISRIVASMDRFLYPNDKFPNLDRITVPQHEQRKMRNLPEPVPPHMTFKYRWYGADRLSVDMNHLMFSGTISCCAVQLAYLMGAKRIDLYGCNFSHTKKSHYFYDTTQDQIGRVRPSQCEAMDSLLGEVRASGVEVVIYGPSKLTQFDRQSQ